jgi:hypothetical protein
VVIRLQSNADFISRHNDSLPFLGDLSATQFGANSICEIANLIDRRNADALFLCQRPISRALSDTLTRACRANNHAIHPRENLG